MAATFTFAFDHLPSSRALPFCPSSGKICLKAYLTPPFGAVPSGAIPSFLSIQRKSGFQEGGCWQVIQEIRYRQTSINVLMDSDRFEMQFVHQVTTPADYRLESTITWSQSFHSEL